MEFSEEQVLRYSRNMVLAEVGPEGMIAGVDINATHLLAVRSGWITGTATALRIGKTLATYDVTLTDDQGRQVCAARITVALRRADDD